MSNESLGKAWRQGFRSVWRFDASSDLREVHESNKVIWDKQIARPQMPLNNVISFSDVSRKKGQQVFSNEHLALHDAHSGKRLGRNPSGPDSRKDVLIREKQALQPAE